MNYRRIKTNKNILLSGPFLLIPDKFVDERGFFMESWNEKTFDNIVKSPIKFVQDNHSNSKKNVIRGLHFQLPPNDQAKLVRCISGKIFDVIVDIRKSSPTFLNWAGVILDAKSHNQLWIPSGFAHGFMSLDENSEIIYKTTSSWSKNDERTIRWDDNTLKIDWPIEKTPPIISIKDKTATTIESMLENDFFP
tara:strand:+ start:211 stop:789 length:579 start_codon:yes stop_codon:yes gene_type:complete